MTKPPHRLTAEERALWARVVATVKPIKHECTVPPAARSEPVAKVPVSPERLVPAKRVQLGPLPKAQAPKTGSKPQPTTLDASWDRRLSRGLTSPDSSIDLHGHTLASAHAMLDQALARAIERGDRLLLLITGKPPRRESERPHSRGAIRAAVGDWLAASPHAERIAAVRNAHPRHGGQGALYVVLRRDRAGSSRKF